MRNTQAKRVISIEKLKNIEHLDFCIPEQPGVFLLVGANGTGKTTLLTCINRICDGQSFSKGFSSSQHSGEIDQYTEAKITYFVRDRDNPSFSVSFQHGTQRWTSSPRIKTDELPIAFNIPSIIYIRADSNRIAIKPDEIIGGRYDGANQQICDDLNYIFETDRFSKLRRLRNSGRGRYGTYFYIIQQGRGKFYSEKRFSTGEVAMLRLVERIRNDSTLQSGSIILIDEAELALHPRIQRNLLSYLKTISEEKQLTVIISTHSVTMIKETSKERIMLLEGDNGIYSIVTPCYHARALGSVDFMSASLPDVILFVEDDMARIVLEDVIAIIGSTERKVSNAKCAIIPVGGFPETAKLALDIKGRLQNKTQVCAFWDHDVFAENLNDPEYYQGTIDLYSANKDSIFDLQVTPEVWIIEALAEESVKNTIRDMFGCDVAEIQRSDDYMQCNSPKTRYLAKTRVDVVVRKLRQTVGNRDSEELVRNKLIEVLTKEAFPISAIKQTIVQVFAHA